MPAQRFFIAPYEERSGLQTNVKPWIIPDEAFAELNNAYVFRGRVRKRFGSQWLGNDSLTSRLRINIGVTAGGSLAGNVRTITGDAGMPTSIGQAFSAGGIIFTVFNPAAAPQQMLRSDNVVAAATYDLATSAFNITGTGLPNGTIVYFYPSLPLTGLLSAETNAIEDEFLIGFDERFAYQYVGGWERLNGEVTPGAAVWTGNDAQLFWGTNLSGANASDKVFFTTNFNENEPNFMRFFFNNQWDNFRPQIDATPNFLNSARIIVPFKNRLVAFNTWEGPAAPLPGTNFSNRCRYSQVGSPLAVNAWRQDIPGTGSAIDASTTEAIITVEFIKDRLIVFFERSTWELAYTGNQAYPFTWQQINTELGAESTFSVVPFDRVAIGVGNVGIHACNGANVERIDDKIPQIVFDIHQVDEGIERVYGIRDYYVEMIYWTFPTVGETSATKPFPNRVFVYNYKAGTWAFNDDSITVFGYYQPLISVLWNSVTTKWGDSVPWGSGSLQAKFRQVVAGNQEGFTFICNADVPTNASVLQITNITVSTFVNLTIINHNLLQNDYIFIEGATWNNASNDLNLQIFLIIGTPNNNTVTIDASSLPSGTYIGGGTVARVSKISIKTKEYNFFAEKGRNSYVSKVDFMVDSTASGQLEVKYFTSTSITNLLTASSLSGTLLGTGNLDTFPYPTIPFEADALRLWHPVYFQADGEVIQLQLTMNDTQMKDVDIWQSDFQLHAMCIYAEPTSYRFQ